MPVDPLATNQVEVIRGPATLALRLAGDRRRGGGDQQPHSRRAAVRPALPPLRSRRPGKPCVSFETRGAVTTVDNGRDGAALLDAGDGNFAIHADVFGRKADDYRIPQYPYLMPPDPADAPNATQPRFNGQQPNSSRAPMASRSAAPTSSATASSALAVTQNNALYHIPGIDGEDHNTRIDAHQTKVITKGEWRVPAAGIDAIRFWGGATDYKHNEIGLADDADLGSDGVRQTFTNKEQEGRVEVQFMPFNLRIRHMTTAIGVQGGHQQLTAPSPDDPTSPLNGLWDPNSNSRIAGYMFNEFKFSETTKAQIAGRIERVNLSGTVPDVHPADVRRHRRPGEHRPGDGARPALHAEERQRRPDPEPALESRRQHHGAIYRARAEARRTVLPRRARCHRDVRHRQSRT